MGERAFSDSLLVSNRNEKTKKQLMEKRSKQSKVFQLVIFIVSFKDRIAVTRSVETRARAR